MSHIPTTVKELEGFVDQRMTELTTDELREAIDQAFMDMTLAQSQGDQLLGLFSMIVSSRLATEYESRGYTGRSVEFLV